MARVVGTGDDQQRRFQGWIGFATRLCRSTLEVAEAAVHLQTCTARYNCYNPHDRLEPACADGLDTFSSAATVRPVGGAGEGGSWHPATGGGNFAHLYLLPPNPLTDSARRS